MKRKTDLKTISLLLGATAVVTAVGLLTLPASAGATSSPVATDIRFGDHGAYVRVVIDFNGAIAAREVEFQGLGRRMATVRLNHPGVTTQTGGGSGEGVTVALQPGTQGLQIAMSYAPRKFKYLSYAVVTGNRLAIDLWKNVVPKFVTESCDGLTLGKVDATKPGVVSASGTEHGIFEHQFQTVVRSARGTVIGRKHVVAAHGSWSTKVRYSSPHGQSGTFEAVAFSAKDGALECIAEISVMLRATG